MQLGYSEVHSNIKINIIVIWSVAVILGISAFAAFISSIGIAFNIRSMMSGNPVGGLIYVWDAIADKLGTVDFIIVEKYAGPNTGYGMFLTILLLFNVLVAYLILQSRTKWLLMVYAVPLVIAEMCWSIGPGIAEGMSLAVVLFLAFITMDNKDSLSWPQLLGLASSVIIAVIVVSVVSGTVTFTEPTNLQKCGSSVISHTNDLRYSTNKGLCNGQLNSLRSRSTGNETALTVTMSRPQSMYLRGYIGEVYMGNEWAHLSNQTYYDARNKLYWLNKNKFSGLTQLASSETLAGGRSVVNTVTVTNKNADRRNVYVPYELKNEKVDNVKSCADGYLAATGIIGVSRYSYKTTENLTGSWTDWVSKLYSQKKTDAISKYFICESHYNVFQYQHYLGIPDDIKTLLRREIGYAGNQDKSHIDYKTAIQNVRTYLEDNYVYSEHLTKLKSNEDFVGDFVKKHRGCDIHYATMATLMFRYYGIPARYVEGYLITPADAEKAEPGSTVDVRQSRIHAWTEIYIDGYGWVPVEVTPKYYGIMKTADMTKGLESIDYQDQFKVIRDNGQGTEKNRDESQQNKKLLVIIVRIILCCILMLLIILLAIFVVKRLIAAVKQRRAFYDSDCRSAVCAIYACMLSMGLDIGEEAEETGNYAAYSLGSVTETQRGHMLDAFKRMRNEKKKAVRKNSRNRIKRFFGSMHRLQFKNRRKEH